jgi:hypothetical protein
VICKIEFATTPPHYFKLEECLKTNKEEDNEKNKIDVWVKLINWNPPP